MINTFIFFKALKNYSLPNCDISFAKDELCQAYHHVIDWSSIRILDRESNCNRTAHGICLHMEGVQLYEQRCGSRHMTIY